MVFRPLLSVILSTYQRPEHLRRSLVSLAMQRGVCGEFEVVVTDDGSQDHTADVVRRLARAVDFRVHFTTHEHNGFQLARCRNDGAWASRAPYLLFSDGDCIFPPDHLQQHLRARRPGLVRAGDCFRFDESASRRVDDAAIATGAYREWISDQERRRIKRRWIKDRMYEVIRHRRRPKLTGCNIALWRRDFEHVNGFDERFVGWGCEDDDLNYRLRRAGVAVGSILGYTQGYHLWHPPHSSRPAAWADGPNVEYLLRDEKPISCLVGLTSIRSATDESVDVTVFNDQSSSYRAKAA